MAAFLSILIVPALLECYRLNTEKKFVLCLFTRPEEDEQAVFALSERFALYSGGDVFGLGSSVSFRDMGGLDEEEAEIVYWDKQEWHEQPEAILNAILVCLQDPDALARFHMKKLKHLL